MSNSNVQSLIASCSLYDRQGQEQAKRHVNPPPIRRILGTLLAATSIALITASLAGAEPKIPHPDNTVVLHVVSRPGGFALYPDAAEVTVRGDGRVVIRSKPEADGWAKRVRFRVTERGIQRVLRGARTAGLFEDPRYGNPTITDQGTTTIDLRAAGIHQQVDVYALLLDESDQFVQPDEQGPRARLRDFVRGISGTDFYKGTIVKH